MYFLQMIIVFDEMFYLHRKIIDFNTNRAMMYWMLQYVGNSEDVIQYGYEVNNFLK